MVKNPFARKTVGLVLSGGGTHGYAHIGVLEVLESHGIVPNLVVGSSVGSLVGSCVAAGKSSKEIFDYFIPLNTQSLLSFSFKQSGLLKSETTVKYVLDFIGKKTFRDLDIPLIVNAANINTGKEKLFRKGSLEIALAASVAVPGVFAPVAIKNNFFVDGSLSNNLPLDTVKDMDVIIAVDISYFNSKITTRSTSLSILKNSIAIMQRKIIDDTLKNFNFKKKTLVFIRPVLDDISIYDIRKKTRLDLFRRGRLEARKVLRKVLAR